MIYTTAPRSGHSVIQLFIIIIITKTLSTLKYHKVFYFLLKLFYVLVIKI